MKGKDGGNREWKKRPGKLYYKQNNPQNIDSLLESFLP